MQRASLYGLLERRAKHIGQGVFPYPGLVQSEVKIYKGYMRDVFLDAVIPIIETYRLLQGAYASNVVKLDAGHKVHIRLPVQATIHASMAVHS